MSPSISETGHAKNVANLEDLISFCTGYGATYNPSKVGLKLPGLNTLFTNAKASLVTVNTSLAAYNNSVNVRKVAFRPLDKLALRIVSALEATDAKKETVDDAKGILRKLQGRRAKPLPKAKTPAPGAVASPDPEPTTISVSQKSIDNLIENFSKLVVLLQGEPLYLPNENDLKVATLNTLLTTLKANNTAVVNNATALSNARVARNKLLYQDDTGLHDITVEVKKYVRSLFGNTSPEFRQISKIRFTKFKE